MIRDLLFTKDPYENFPVRESEVNGWNSRHPKLAELIHETQPNTILELGSWLGASALYMAESTDAEIVCVDTWTGAEEMWKAKDDPTRYLALKIEHGYPTIYRDFMSNVIKAGKQHQITPCPLPTGVALRFFKSMNVKPDLIYVDADHAYESVKQDIEASLLLKPKVICGDDFLYWSGVQRAVNDLLPYREFDPAGSGFWWVSR